MPSGPIKNQAGERADISRPRFGGAIGTEGGEAGSILFLMEVGEDNKTASLEAVVVMAAAVEEEGEKFHIASLYGDL